MSIILGLHTGHDGSACIVKNGRLVAALSAERVTRQKKSAIVQECLDAVLTQAEVGVEEIDAVSLTDWYAEWAHGTCEVYSADERYTDRDGYPLQVGAPIPDSWDRIWGDAVWKCNVRIKGRDIPGYNVAHHKAHSAAAFYTSPFEDAWCISMDSSGAKPMNNFSVCRGHGNSLYDMTREYCMAGVAYGMICERLGIGHQMTKAGSMMALAAYGTVIPQVRERIHCFREYPFFKTDGDYHKWLREIWQDWSRGLEFSKDTSDSQTAMDIAATMQFVFEEAILCAVERLPDDEVRNICLSGGSFLNCNANTAVLNHNRVDNVHLFPGCADDGLAVGSALHVAHQMFDEPRHTYKLSDIAYLGPSYAESKATNYKRVAKAIAEGAVVAWFDGRSEYGPRALGHRSMLADPRTIRSKERINGEIKKREWYRPLSPSVLAEKSHEWFDFPGPSPFMLFTVPCKKPECIPAVVHVDGTARMQTVAKADNPHYYALIQAFDRLTGIPMVLNTSLNVDGQPILETVEDMREFWERGIVDMAVVNGEIWERECTSN